MKNSRMEKVKRAVAIAAAALIAMGMTGCSDTEASDTASAGSTSSEAADSGETVLKVGYVQEPSSFDPADFTSISSVLTGYDCYDTILNFSEDGTTVVPGLAESWEQVDELTYTYKFRDGIKFTDGNELTMEDVLYSLNRVSDQGYYMSYLFAAVESFEADEETRTLTVHLYYVFHIVNKYLAVANLSRIQYLFQRINQKPQRNCADNYFHLYFRQQM